MNSSLLPRTHYLPFNTTPSPRASFPKIGLVGDGSDNTGEREIQA